jgi:hypothetical protein
MPTQVQPTDTKRKLASLRSRLRHLDTLIRAVEDYDRWISGATSQRVVRDNNGIRFIPTCEFANDFNAGHAGHVKVQGREMRL